MLLEKFGELRRDEKLVFCIGYIALTLYRIYKRGLEHAMSAALFKHITHHGPRSGIPYYNLTTTSPIETALSIYNMGTHGAVLWI
jgi:hypothetical protein